MASIRFTGPDGHVFEFEDGTPEHVRRAFIQRHYGTSAEQTNSRRSAAVSLSAPKDKRSLGERLGDVFSNTVNTGFIAEGWRAGLDDTADYIEAAQRGDHKAALKVNDRFTLNPIRLVSRLYNSGGVLTDMTQNTQDTREAADDWVSRERARRQEFAQASRDDPFWQAEGGIVGKTLHGGAALLGTLGGAALDPTSYITGGTSIGAKIAVQATVAGAVDLLAQTDATGLTQDRYDVLQTVLSAGAGAAFTGAFEGAGALLKGRGNVRARIDADLRSEPVNLSQTFRDELDTADAISLPALTRDDWTFRPTQQGPVSALPMRVEAPRAERMDGPRVDGADAGPDIKPEWTKGMSPERLKAVTEHLDRLKAFIKPDQVERFVRWAGKEDVNITDDPSPHWNQEIFDFDKLANEPEKFEEIVGVMAQIFKPLYDAAGDAKQTWKSVRDRQAAFGVTVSDVVKAHSDITGDNGIAAKMHALETISIQHTDHLVTKMAALEKSLNGGDINSGLIGDVAAQLQATVMFDAMAAGAKSEIGRALNIMKMAKQRTRILNDIQGQMDLMADALGTGDLDPKSLAEALKKLREAYGSGGERALKDELRKGRHMGFGDYLSYYIVAGYLTTPATAVRNAVGSVLHASMTVGERYIAAGITSPLRRGLGGKRTSAEGVTFREANAYLFGIHQSFVDATSLRVLEKPRADLHADEVTASLQGGDARRAAPHGAIQHRVGFVRKGADQVVHQRDRLLGLRRIALALHLFPLAYAREEQDRSRPVRVSLIAAPLRGRPTQLVERILVQAVAGSHRLVQFDQTLRVVGRVDLGVIPHAALREHQNILMLREDAIVLVKVLGLASLRPDHRIAVKVESRRDQRGRETTLRGHYDIPGRRKDAPKLREHLVHRDDLVPRLDRHPVGQVHSNQVHGLVRQLRHCLEAVSVEQRRLDRLTLHRHRRRKRLDGAVQTLRSLGIVARVQFDPDVMASRRASRDARRPRPAEHVADHIMLGLQMLKDAARQFDRHRRRVRRINLGGRTDRQHVEQLARSGEFELRLRQQMDKFEARIQEVLVGRIRRLTMPDDTLAKVAQNISRDQFFGRQQTALEGLVLVLEEDRAVVLKDAPALRQEFVHPLDVIGMGQVVAEGGVALGQLSVPQRTAALIATGATLVVGRREEEDRDGLRRLGLEPLQRVARHQTRRASLGECRIGDSGKTSASDLLGRQIRVSVAAIDVYQAATGRPLVKHICPTISVTYETHISPQRHLLS